MCEERIMFQTLKDWLKIDKEIELHTYKDYEDTQSGTYEYHPEKDCYGFNINLSTDEKERLLTVAHGFAVLLLNNSDKPNPEKQQSDRENERRVAELLYRVWENYLREKEAWLFQDFTYLLEEQPIAREE